MCFVNILIQYSRLTKYGFWCASKVIQAFSDFHFLSLSHHQLGNSCLEQWGPIFLQFCSYKCVLSIFIYKAYNIALQNTDFGVLQKISKHFLISIFFPMGRGDTTLPHPPPTRHFVPRTRASPLFITIHAPPPPLPPNPGSATGCVPRTSGEEIVRQGEW